MTEIWMPVPGYESRYRVSNMGNVKSIFRYKKVLKGIPSNQGYQRVTLTDGRGHSRNFSIHRLVALVFLDNPLGHPQVNHKNAVKTDNRAENLEWCTASQNQLHAVVMGIKNVKRGEELPQSKLSEDQVRFIRDKKGKISQQMLADMLGVKRPLISKVQLGKRWTHV